MDAQQIISIIIFVVTMAAIMTEKVHRALAAVAGATLLLVCQILDVESLASYIDFIKLRPMPAVNLLSPVKQLQV